MLEGYPQPLRPLLGCSTVGDELEYIVPQLLQGRALREDVHALMCVALARGERCAGKRGKSKGATSYTQKRRERERERERDACVTVVLVVY